MVLLPEIFVQHYHIAVMCNSTTCTISFRDHATDVLFEDEGEDQPLPVCILDALLKVHTYGVQHRQNVCSNYIFSPCSSCYHSLAKLCPFSKQHPTPTFDSFSFIGSFISAHLGVSFVWLIEHTHELLRNMTLHKCGYCSTVGAGCLAQLSVKRMIYWGFYSSHVRQIPLNRRTLSTKNEENAWTSAGKYLYHTFFDCLSVPEEVPKHLWKLSRNSSMLKETDSKFVMVVALLTFQG